MAITTFSTLKTAILAWAERTDLTSYDDDFVNLADARIRKDLAGQSIRLREMETSTDLTPSSGAVSVPSNFLAMKRVQAQTSDKRRLQYQTQDWLDEAYPDGASGVPSFYTIAGSSLYMFPLTTSSIRITYYAYPTALSDDDPTNWLLTKYPDIYLYAGLVELELYTGNTEGVSKWLSAYSAAMEGLAASGADESITPGTSRATAGGAW